MILDHQIPVVPIHWKSEDWDSAALGPDLSARTAPPGAVLGAAVGPEEPSGERGRSGFAPRATPSWVAILPMLRVGVFGDQARRRPRIREDELEEGGWSGRETIQKKAAQHLKQLSGRPHKGA